MGFIGKHVKPVVAILFGSQDCLFKTFCIREGSHMTFFTAPLLHSVHCEACPDPQHQLSQSSAPL